MLLPIFDYQDKKKKKKKSRKKIEKNNPKIQEDKHKEA
jgi:hypothetical protein